MEFKINENVFVFNEGKHKIILDSEIIADTEIYYMSDGTAYPLNELAPIKSCENTLLKQLFKLEPEKIFSALKKKQIHYENLGLVNDSILNSIPREEILKLVQKYKDSSIPQ